ncbi:GNAT family N-acetyltransferase [Cellulomonas sp. APG4]|uniref:GNAT family N-acetyltransferase n=1 Tax=Cellulomonas sp. APG4 TaxID=1538656 RepID=UPI00137ABB02|nr:GNAT family N-acetyltransferase [Cellulomonas sp. APG4]NCT90656.1 GNAT family N-acetyltransferase [Cellulomonas sp. APG4]
MSEELPAPGALIETATWPPVDVSEVGGWRVGRSGGFTRRANSALPSLAAHRTRLGDLAATAAVARTLGEVEALYAEHGARSVVRLDPRTAPGLDRLLAERGYRAVAPTVVMAAPLAGTSREGALPGGTLSDRTLSDRTLSARTPSARTPSGGTLPDGMVPSRVSSTRATGADGLRVAWSERPDDGWLETWLGVKATTTTDATLARRILEGAPARYLTAHDAGGRIGVLRAAPSHGWLALSCLAVERRARRRGVARALTRVALEGAPAGVGRAFLQVEESNRAAVALYRQMGFVPVDAYHYRER